MSEWISVIDKLPEDTLNDKEKSKRKQIRCIASDGKKVWTTTRMRYKIDSYWFWKSKSPDFWMPLPEPPKAD